MSTRTITPSPVILFILGGLLMFIAVGIESPVALAIVLMEGTVAFAVLGFAALSGLWVPHLLGLRSLSWPQQIIFGAASGIGTLSLLVLTLGTAGILTRPVAIILVVLLALAGIGYLARYRIRNESSSPPASITHLNWLWLLLVPFSVIMLLAATLPPGVLWQEEGFGYDVLEYHLAVPKTFFEQHRITFLPGNVYSNFPLNSEMLSLLMMVFRGDSIEAAFMATFVNVALAALFVAAAWLAGRCYSRESAIITAVFAGTTGWLTYLSGIAFVEPGMLAMGMAALAAMLHATRDPQNRLRWMLLAGALAGFAAGFKYTAVPMIALPLLIYPLSSGTLAQRCKIAVLYGLAAFITFSPWLIRNTVNTHNPFFPEAYSVFGAKDGLWTLEQAARWNNAHSLAGGEHTTTPTYVRAWQRTFTEPRMGFALWILALGGISSETLALMAIGVWQFAFWLWGTHLFARFAVLMLLPLVLLAARCISSPPAWKWGRVVTMALLIVGAFSNLYHIADLYYHHTRATTPLVMGELVSVPLNAYGRTDWFVDGQWPGTRHWAAINHLSAGSKVLLVAEARSFYIRTACEYATVFDRHPLSRIVREKSEADVLKWLREEGFSHILVDWSEMQRLAGSYGFDERLNADCFARLQTAGLKVVETFVLQEGRPPYATLYEVPVHE